jgi:hypothetical protein
MWLFHQFNQSTYVTDGVTVPSCSASPLLKINVAMYHVCQITLNQILLHKFEKCFKFSSHTEAKLRTKNSRKMKPVFIHTS